MEKYYRRMTVFIIIIIIIIIIKSLKQVGALCSVRFLKN